MNEKITNLAEEFALSEFGVLYAKGQEISTLILNLKKHLKKAEENKSIKLCIVRNKVKKGFEKILGVNILQGINGFEFVQIIKNEEEAIGNYNETFRKIAVLIEGLIQSNFSNGRGFFEELCNIINEKIDYHFGQENKKLRMFGEELKKQINGIIVGRFELSLKLKQTRTTKKMIRNIIKQSLPFISKRKTEAKQKELLRKEKKKWKIIGSTGSTNMTY